MGRLWIERNPPHGWTALSPPPSVDPIQRMPGDPIGRCKKGRRHLRPARAPRRTAREPPRFPQAVARAHRTSAFQSGKGDRFRGSLSGVDWAGPGATGIAHRVNLRLHGHGRWVGAELRQNDEIDWVGSRGSDRIKFCWRQGFEQLIPELAEGWIQRRFPGSASTLIRKAE